MWDRPGGKPDPLDPVPPRVTHTRRPEHGPANGPSTGGRGGRVMAAHMGRKRGRSAYLPGAARRRRHPPAAAAILVVAAVHARTAPAPPSTRCHHLGCADNQDGGGAWTVAAERCAHALPRQPRWRRQREGGGGGERLRGGKRIAPASSPCGPPSRGPLPPVPGPFAGPSAPCESHGAVTNSRAP